MRLRITHETTYRYADPAMTVIQILRMRPRGHEGQFVVDWRIELDRDAHLQVATDAFGNIIHSFNLTGPIDVLTVTATGEIETENTAGVIRQQLERFAETMFLRETPLTASDTGIRQFAEETMGGIENPLERLHALNLGLYQRFTYDNDRTHVHTTAAEAFAAGHGVCQDYAHVFIAAARHLDIPARYVGGYLYRDDLIVQEAGHGWAEAFVPGLGWVAFDPTHGICATEAYVRVAVGLDYLGAAPIRGSQHGGSGETMAVVVTVEDIGS